MKASPPATIEVTRGNRVESRHLADIVVADADGGIVRVHGQRNLPVYPRSANKALQALPLVELGAADRYGLKPRHLALACASHNGEEMHVTAAAEMLAAAGLEPACLECGAHWPLYHAEQIRLANAGRMPEAIHNNCSGKHSGFLCFAAYEGIEPKGYVKIGHKVQRALAGVLEETTGAPHRRDNHGIDGCSIPTYAIPLAKLAVAYAKFGVGKNRGAVRSKAMLRLRDACLKHPEMVAGADRFDTQLMQVLKGRVFTKTGAEGVFIASLPEKGIGIALKVRDGATRAAEAAIAAQIESLLELSQSEAKALKRLRQAVMKNWNGITVGQVNG